MKGENQVFGQAYDQASDSFFSSEGSIFLSVEGMIQNPLPLGDDFYHVPLKGHELRPFTTLLKEMDFFCLSYPISSIRIYKKILV